MLNSDGVDWSKPVVLLDYEYMNRCEVREPLDPETRARMEMEGIAGAAKLALLDYCCLTGSKRFGEIKQWAAGGKPDTPQAYVGEHMYVLANELEDGGLIRIYFYE